MDVSERRLILVVGKGGVGRSTVAAAIAGQLAARGKKTLLFETNANDRFGSYFDKPPVGEKVTQLATNLYAVNTNPASALAEYGLMILKFKSVYEMVFENRVTRAFLRAIPGLDDYALLGKAWFHTEETSRGKPVWDTVVFDMPASGHSISMLRIPQVITDTVPEGPLTRDARTIKDLLADPKRTAAVLVTLAEEMPVNETANLEAELTGDIGISVDRVIMNALYPESFSKAELKQVKKLASSDDEEVRAAGRAGASQATRAAAQREQLTRLEELVKTDVSTLPFIFKPELDLKAARQLAEEID